MRHINQAGLDLIKEFEGYRRLPYVCPAGYPTVGYGHVILDGEIFSGGIGEEMAETLLRSDLFKVERSVERLIFVPLTDNQFAALVSLTFNLGGGALQRSALRIKLNRGDYEGAADEFLRWTKAKGRVLPGLVRRRIAERELFLAN